MARPPIWCTHSRSSPIGWRRHRKSSASSSLRPLINHLPVRLNQRRRFGTRCGGITGVHARRRLAEAHHPHTLGAHRTHRRCIFISTRGEAAAALRDVEPFHPVLARKQPTRSIACVGSRALACRDAHAWPLTDPGLGGRHWTRTSDLLHVKHPRLSAVLGAWDARAKSPQLYGHGITTVGRELVGDTGLERRFAPRCGAMVAPERVGVS